MITKVDKLSRWNKAVLPALAIAYTLSGAPAFSDEQRRASVACQCQAVDDRSPKDEVSCKQVGNQLHVIVKYHWGIGSARVTRGSAPWPVKIQVELQQFHNLEAFSVSSGPHRLQTSLRTSPITWGRNSAEEPEHELPSRIEIKAEADRIIAIIPAEVIAWNVDEFTIGWIDAYRR